MELDKLEVLQRQPCARGHCVAVAGAGVCGGGRVPGAAVPTSRQHRVLALKTVEAPVLHAERHDANACALLVHDEIEREVLNEEFGVVADGLAVERVQ